MPILDVFALALLIVRLYSNVGHRDVVMMDNKTYQDFQTNIAELTRLAAAQIQVCMSEVDVEVNQLTDSFTDIVNQDRRLRELIESLPENEEVLPIKQSISMQSTALGSNVRNSIIAFQFFDRMCQRLEHSIECLKELSNIEETNFEAHIGEIDRLKDAIYKSYTMEEERSLYDELLSKHDFDQAINDYLQKRAVVAEDDDDDIEFF